MEGRRKQWTGLNLLRQCGTILSIAILLITVTGCDEKSLLSKLTSRLGPRTVRTNSAAKVALVPGMPDSLYWQVSQAHPKAVVLALHELGLHSGVFDDMGKRMSRAGIAVYAIDLRGHGAWQAVKSPEAKMDLDRTFADVKASLEEIKKKHPGIPVFVLGEAMGGALALKVGATYPELVHGVISSAPGGEHFNTSGNYAKVAGGVLSLSKDSGMSIKLMQQATPKEDLRDTFIKDSQVRLDLTPRELMACQFFMYKTKKFASQIKDKPVLIVHGEKDGESRPVGSTKVYDNLATKDKKFLSVADGDHYIYEDINVNDQVLDGTVSWINDHITSATN